MRIFACLLASLHVLMVEAWRAHPWSTQIQKFQSSLKAPCSRALFRPTNSELRMSTAAIDLENIGEDIQVAPPSNGVVKIVMKFGGSSLASAGNVPCPYNLTIKIVLKSRG